MPINGPMVTECCCCLGFVVTLCCFSHSLLPKPPDDLVTDQVLTHHDTKRGAFVVQWTNVMAPASQLPIGTFQAWLFPNGALGYVYRDLYSTEQALGSSAVVGELAVAVAAHTHA